MRRLALIFLLAISLAGTLALWPEDDSHLRAERLAAPLAMELVALSAAPTALRDRLAADPLVEMVAIWNPDGLLTPPVEPRHTRYDITSERQRALEGLLSGQIMPIWARAPFAETDAVVRCQRTPDICIVFAAQPLAQRLDFPPERLIRPLQGPYALAPALMLGALAAGSGLMLLWRQWRRR